MAAYAAGSSPVPGYQLLDFLGQGSHGEVWRASGPGGTVVALKIIRIMDEQGLKELRALNLYKKLRHAHLVPIHALFVRDATGQLLPETLLGQAPQAWTSTVRGGEFIIAMGLAERNLRERLLECQRQGEAGIPHDELLEYLGEAARALEYLHATRHDLGSGPVALQHCGIKPSNLLLVGSSVQVADYGLSRPLGAGAVSAPAIAIAYAAPEILSDGKPSDHVDQYALAITYVELRTGSLPFKTLSPAAMLSAHLQARLDWGKLPPEEREVLQRATARRPQDRFPTTLDFVRALRQCQEAMDELPPAPGRGSMSIPLATPLATEQLEPRPTGEGVEIVPGYRLVKCLGAGSYGEVWEAIGPGKTRAALKIIRDLDEMAGRQEFRAIELLKEGVEHDHLLDVMAYWLLDKEDRVIRDEDLGKPGVPFPTTLVLATRLARKNLEQRLQECRQAGMEGIPPAELLRYVFQAAEALDYLNEPRHQLGDQLVSIQHRDVKPENILLVGDSVKVADFGLAKALTGESGVVNTRSRGFTVAYAAPELFKDRVTRWSDQYSLALTYYRLRTGRLPFPKHADVDVMLNAHLDGKLDFSLVGPAETHILQRATRRTPDERFPSCLTMVKALATAVLGDEAPSVLEGLGGRIRAALDNLTPPPPSKPSMDLASVMNTVVTPRPLPVASAVLPEAEPIPYAEALTSTDKNPVMKTLRPSMEQVQEAPVATSILLRILLYLACIILLGLLIGWIVWTTSSYAQ